MPNALSIKYEHGTHIRPVDHHPQQYVQGDQQGFHQPPALKFDLPLLMLLIQLVQLLLKGIEKPPSEPQPLLLNQSQQSNLKQLMGVDPNAPFSLEVLDNDDNDVLNSGDTAIVSGGITGGEVQRRVLTDADIAQINAPQGRVPADLTENQNKWNAFSGDPDAFIRYTTQQSCFCPVEFNRPINVTERGGEITSAIYMDTGEVVPDNVRQSLQTVGQRFEQLRNAYESGADTINVTYDSQFGYPNSVFIDQSRLIADEEVRFMINDLVLALH